MCELFAATASEPFELERAWPLVAGIERFGIAGFGWGLAWIDPAGELRHHVSTDAFRDDPAGDALARETARSVLVHLRRPSRLSTWALPDAQPFADPQGRFAFVHNGDLAHQGTARPTYAAEGRLHGRADSEVGQRWLEDAWGEEDACDVLAGLHAVLGGQANLMALAADGTTHVYAGNTENPIFRYRLDGLEVASTALYSIDRSLFRLVAKGARERRVLRPSETLELGPLPKPV